MHLETNQIPDVLILHPGPNWEKRSFEEIRKGDIFLLVSPNDGQIGVPAVSLSDAALQPSELRGIHCQWLGPLSKDQISMVYGPAERAGLPHCAIVAGLVAIAKTLQDERQTVSSKKA